MQIRRDGNREIREIREKNADAKGKQIKYKIRFNHGKNSEYTDERQMQMRNQPRNTQKNTDAKGMPEEPPQTLPSPQPPPWKGGGGRILPIANEF